MIGTLQRVEQETVSSQNLAEAIENLSRTRSEVTGSRLRLKDGERLYPKSWSGSTPPGGFAREVAAWLVYVDPKHEAGKLMQRITKGRLRATEAWTDGRYDENDKYAELDHGLAVVLANVTEGAARSTVLKVTQTEPSRGFVTWQPLVDGYAPKSSNDPALAATHTCDTSKMQGHKGTKREAHSMVTERGRVRASIQSDRWNTEDACGEGDDAEGHPTGVPDGTEKVRRNHCKTGDHHQ